MLRINLTARLARLGLCRRFFVEAILTLHRAKDALIPLIILSRERYVGTRFDLILILRESTLAALAPQVELQGTTTHRSRISDVVGSRACSVNARGRAARARRVTDAAGGAPCKGTTFCQLPWPLAPASVLRWRWRCAAPSPAVALGWRHTNDSHGHSATAAAAAWQASRRRRRRATHLARARRWG